MTQRKKTHASYSQRHEFWQSVDMELYHNNLNYREKVERAWDKHRYLYDYEARIDIERTSGED